MVYWLKDFSDNGTFYGNIKRIPFNIIFIKYVQILQANQKKIMGAYLSIYNVWK